MPPKVKEGLGYGLARFVRRAFRRQSIALKVHTPPRRARRNCGQIARACRVPQKRRADSRERRADFAFHAFCRGITWTCDQQLGTYAPVRMRTRAPNQTPLKVRPAVAVTGRSRADTPSASLSGGGGTQRFDRASTGVGCCRPQEPSPAVRSKQAACDVRGPAHCRARDLRLSLKVQRRRSPGWAWRSLSASYFPTGPIRCGGCQA